MGRSRRAHPDYVVDPDRGSSAVPSTKRATFMNVSDHLQRGETRSGARDLDTMVEQAPGLTRQQRDRERAMPRDVTREVPHPAMERRLPIPDALRQPLSSRQRKARSVSKRAAQDRLPQTQYDAVHRAITDDGHWRQINDVLSESVGDVQELDDRQRAQVQRLDRAIQTYENSNDRGHVLYANVEMPTMINSSNLAGFVRNHFTSGDEISFDRFTGAAHSIHEVETVPEIANRTAVFEIQTRRGMYLGRSDSLDDTTHLLPRGMRLRVVSAHLARYQRPDGSEGRRHVIQLADADQ